MTLEEWLEKNERNKSWLAKKTGMHRSGITIYLKSKNCSLKTALKLVKATNFEISLFEALPEAVREELNKNKSLRMK